MINVFGSSFDETELESLRDSIASGWLGIGPKVRLFESEFEKKVKKPFVMVNNGSNALHLAVRLLRLKKGSKVMLPSFTYVACINAILLEGLEPVLIDVNPEDGNITADTVRKKWIRGVKAIMPVHYAGKPCDMESLKEFGIPLVEDAAHAVDTMIGDEHCGSIGDFGAFSFDPIKNLPTPDAGGVCMSENLVEEARCLRDLGLSSTGLNASSHGGRWWVGQIKATFPKYTPNDIAACFAMTSLSKLRENQIKRREIWDFYTESFKGLPIETPKTSDAYRHSYFTYLIQTDRRDQLAKKLLSELVYTTLRFHPLHRYKIFSEYRSGRYSGCDKLESQGLNLPIHPRLSQGEVKKIVMLVRRFYNA